MKNKCSNCNSLTTEPKPPKYSPEDKYGDYRRETKKPEYKEKGYL
jgi:rRNA maturation protein Nop10